MTTPETRPADHFRTREGKTIALKPWTFQLLAEHGDDVKRFVEAWDALVTGDGEGTFAGVKAALPALRASVQDPTALDSVHGLSEMLDLIRAVWEYNEVGVGMGKAVALKTHMERAVVQGSNGALEAPQ